MLAPRVRQTLLAALRPPEGYRVDSVVATTFTLDLTALLVAPLSFSLLDLAAERDLRSAKGDAGLDPYALLRAAREHAQRMVVFCEATRIAAPAKYRSLFAYLEKSVVQVCAPDELGVFHPKVWVLRLVGAEGAVRYRVLCASRNLTFDQSWDTLLTLEGDLTDRTNAIAMNRPLSDFVAQLPRLAQPREQLSKERTKLVAVVADELLRVRFELPDGVDRLAFHPLGIEGYQKFRRPDRIQRALVVSPFVDEAGLRPWTTEGTEHVLLSRIDQLDAVKPDALARFASTHVLAEALEKEDDDSEVASGSELRLATAGLHAKLFVVDDGWDAHVWTGSANATNAGFTRNVELLVQMTGKKSVMGVQRFLDGGISEMVQPYARGETAGDEAVEKQLELQLLRLRRQLAETKWVASVAPEGSAFSMTLSFDERRWPETLPIEVRPITLPPNRDQTLTSDRATAVFSPCSLEALTPFFRFKVKVEQGGLAVEEELVLNARLEGAPSDREEQVLASMFKDPSQVMQFLSMLLADDPTEWLGSEAERGLDGTGPGNRGSAEQALLERLLHALHANPAQLDSVQRFMHELSQTESGRAVVTERLRGVWEPIYAARTALTGGAR